MAMSCAVHLFEYIEVITVPEKYFYIKSLYYSSGERQFLVPLSAHPVGIGWQQVHFMYKC